MENLENTTTGQPVDGNPLVDVNGIPAPKVSTKAGNPFFNNAAIVAKDASTDVGRFSDTSSRSPVAAKDYAKYFEEGVSELPGIERVKAENQRWYSQAFNWAVQSVGEIAGGTVSGFGAIGEAGIYAVSETARNQADFDNFLMGFGKSITDYTKEIAPIHRLNPNRAFDMGDFGWWTENGVSIASTISMLIPARAATSAVGWLGKVAGIADKVGDTTKFLGDAALTAGIMRNAENMKESMEVSAKTNKEVAEKLERMSDVEYKEYLKSDVGKEFLESGGGTRQDLARHVAAQAGWHTYQINSANIVFDFIQTATALKAVSAATKIAPTIKVAKAQAAATGKTLSALSKVGIAVSPTFRAFAAQATEGIEEIINYVGGKEGEVKGRQLAGDTESDGVLTSRLDKYVDDPQLWNSGFWGVLGGVAFSGAAQLFERSSIKAINEQRIAEIGNRANLVSNIQKQFAVVEEQRKAGKISEEDAAILQQEAVKAVGTQMGISAALTGNAKLVVEQLQDTTYREKLLGSLTEEEKRNLVSRYNSENETEAIVAYTNELTRHTSSAVAAYKQFTGMFKALPQNDEVKATLLSLAIDAKVDTDSLLARREQLIADVSSTKFFGRELGDIQGGAELEYYGKVEAIKAIFTAVQEGKASPAIIANLTKAVDRLLASKGELDNNMTLVEKVGRVLDPLVLPLVSQETKDKYVELALIDTKIELNQSLLEKITQEKTAQQVADNKKKIEDARLVKEFADFKEGLDKTQYNVTALEQLKATINPNTDNRDAKLDLLETKIKKQKEVEANEAIVQAAKAKADAERLANTEAVAATPASTPTVVEPAQAATPVAEEVTETVETTFEDLMKAIGTLPAQNLKNEIESLYDMLGRTGQAIVAELKNYVQLAKDAYGDVAANYVQNQLDIAAGKVKVTEEVAEVPVVAEIVAPIEVPLVAESTIPANEETNQETVPQVAETQKTETTIEETSNQGIDTVQESAIESAATAVHITSESANVYLAPIFKEIVRVEDGKYVATQAGLDYLNTVAELKEGDEVQLVINRDNEYHKETEGDAAIEIRTADGQLIGYLNTITSIVKAIKDAPDEKSKAVFVANYNATKALRSFIFTGKNPQVTLKITKLTSGTLIKTEKATPIKDVLVGDFELMYADTTIEIEGGVDTLINVDTGDSFSSNAWTNFHNKDMRYTPGMFYALMSGLTHKTEQGNEHKIPVALEVSKLQKKDITEAFKLVQEVIALMRQPNIDFNANSRLNELRTQLGAITYVNKFNENSDGTVPKPFFKIHKEYIEFLAFDNTKLIRIYYSNAKYGHTTVAVHTFNEDEGSYNNWLEFNKMVGKAENYYNFTPERSQEATSFVLSALATKQYQISIPDIKSGQIRAKELIASNKLSARVGVITDEAGNKVSNFIHKEARDQSSNLVLSVGEGISEGVTIPTTSFPVKNNTIVESEPIVNEELDELAKLKAELLKTKGDLDRTTDEVFDAYTMEVVGAENTEEVVTLEERQANWKRWFGDNVQFDGNVDGIIRYKGKKAYGLFHRAMVSLSKFAPEGAEAHEAFHVAMHLYLTEAQRASVYDNARKLYGNLSDVQLEENLAEDFRAFYLTKKTKQTGIIRTLFNRLVAFMENIMGKYSIDRLFRDIEAGVFNYTPTDAAKAYASKIGLTMEMTLAERLGSENLHKYLTYTMGIVNEWLSKNPKVSLKDRVENDNLNVRLVVADHLKMHLDTLFTSAELATSKEQFASYVKAIEITKQLLADVNSKGEFWQRTVKSVETRLNIKIDDDVEFDVDSKYHKDWDDKLAYSKSAKESFDFDLRRTIMSTRAVNSYAMTDEGIKYDFKTNNPALLPEFLNFDYVYNHLATNMTNARTVEEMLERLASLGEADASFYLLWTKINSSDELKAKWFTNFNKTFITAEHHQVLNTDEGLVIKKEVSNKRFKIADDWYANISAVISNDNRVGNVHFNEVYVANTIKLIEAVKVNFTTKADLQETAKMLQKLAADLGIDISAETILKIANNKQLADGDIHNTMRERVYLPLFWMSKAMITNIKSGNKLVFEQRGRLNELAEYAGFYMFDSTESSYFGVDGNMRFSLAIPSYLTEWYDDVNQLFNVFTVNKRKAKERVLAKFKAYAKDPSFANSNWLFPTTENTNTIFNRRVTDVNSLTVDDLNMAFLRTMKVSFEDGLKNLNKRKGAGYSQQSTSDWDIGNLLKYLTTGIKDKATYPIPIQSDSGNIWNFTGTKISIYENGKSVVDKTGKININSALYKAMRNTVGQELARMKQAQELLFTINDKFELVEKEGIDYGSLQMYYHYSRLDSNGTPILIENGKPTGLVFKFHNMNYELDGKMYSLDSAIPRGYYNAQLHNKDMEIMIAEHISNFVKQEVLAGKAKYMKYKDIIEKSKTNKQTVLGAYYETAEGSAYENFVAELMLNTYLNYVEYNNFFNGIVAEYKNTKDTNKRAKQNTSPKQTTGTLFRGVSYKGLTIKDIEITSSFYEVMVENIAEQLFITGKYPSKTYDIKVLKSKTLPDTATQLEKDIYFISSGYLKINRADAQSYVTLSRYKKILQDYGRWNKEYEAMFKKLEAGEDLTKNELGKFLQTLKPFYYDRVFDNRIGKMRSRQVKNSLLPLIPQLVKGSDMEKLMNVIESQGIEEVYFQSATKVGMGYTNIITDSNGKLVEGFGDSLTTETYFNANWGLQLDVPSHLKDEENKLGVQIAKIIVGNLKDDKIYDYNGTKVTGTELKAKYFELLSQNIKESGEAVLQRIGAKEVNGKLLITDYTKIRKILQEEVESRGLPSIYLEALEEITDEVTGAKTFTLPLFVSNLSTKFESVLSSLFTNSVTNQKFPGSHVVLASDAFLTEYASTIDTTGIEFLDEVKDRIKDSNFRLNPPTIVDGKIIESEALLPAWSKKFFHADGKRMDINAIPKELLTMIGYRIPTEAKYSIPVIKIVGFLPESNDSTIILPYELITQTGWDFDVDSLYMMQRSFKGDADSGIELVTGEDSLAGRNNMIFDLYLSVLQNTVHYTEITSPGKFTDPVALKQRQEFLTGLGSDNANPNTRNGQDSFRAANISGRALKGLAANANGLLLILQQVKATFTSGYKMTYDLSQYNKEELIERYGEDVRIDNATNTATINHRRLGWSATGYDNINGNTTTDHAAQMLAMILDIVKEGLPYNINTYTFDTFISMLGAGIDINHAGMFIRQPIINTIAEKSLTDEGILADNTANAIKSVKTDFMTRLYKAMVVEKLITEEDAIDRKLAKRDKTGKFYWLADKTIFLVNSEKNPNIDISKVLGFDINSKDSWTIRELEGMLANSNIKNTNGIKAEGYKGWKDLTNLEKIEYYRNQLMILESFTKYKKNGDAFSLAGKVLATDKLGAGPSLNVTETLQENAEILDGYDVFTGMYAEPLIVTEDRKSLKEAVFTDNIADSAYAPLAAYLKYANINSYQSLGSLFIQYSEAAINAKDTILANLVNKTTEVTSLINGFMKQLVNTKLSYFSLYNKSQILGIDKTLNFDLDITDTNNFETFSKLSTANKLYLVKKQLMEVYENDRTHILNFFKPLLDENLLDRYEITKIQFSKPNNSDNIDNDITMSFDKMFDSDNMYVRDLATDLIAYSYFTTNFSFGKDSFANYIPVRILAESSYVNMRDELGMLKSIIDRTPSYFTDSYKNLAEIFIKNNWNNDAVVPKARSKYKRNDKGERIEILEENGTSTGTYITVDNTPDWSSHSPTDVLIVPNKKLKNENTKVVNANYLLLSNVGVNNEVIQTLFKRYSPAFSTKAEEDADVNENSVDNNTYYYPVSKLSGANIGIETSATSIIADNNTQFPEQVYREQLDSLFLTGKMKNLSEVLNGLNGKKDGTITGC